MTLLIDESEIMNLLFTLFLSIMSSFFLILSILYELDFFFPIFLASTEAILGFLAGQFTFHYSNRFRKYYNRSEKNKHKVELGFWILIIIILFITFAFTIGPINTIIVAGGLIFLKIIDRILNLSKIIRKVKENKL